MTNESRREILAAVRVGLLVNIALAILKLSFGFWGNAQAVMVLIHRQIYSLV